MVVNGKAWRRLIWKRKEEARLRRMPEKTQEQLAKEDAERYIRSVEQEWNSKDDEGNRRYSSTDLLFVMLAQNQLLACEIAIRKIEQQKNLPVKDRKFLRKAKSELAQRQQRLPEKRSIFPSLG